MSGSDREWAYALLRVTFGINIFLHGFVRFFTGVTPFVDDVVRTFAGTMLPAWFVRAFALVISPCEAIVGALLIVGLFTSRALRAGSLLMACLMVGTMLRGDWLLINVQAPYLAGYAVLLWASDLNAWSVDRRFPIFSRRR